jgi:uncharacterized protein
MLRACVALLLGFWFALAGAGANAQTQQGIPVLKQRVTDLTATLSQEQRNQLDARLAAFEREKGSQIAVLIVPSTQPEAIEQYSIRVVEQWKLGRKGVDDGVLLLVAKQDRKLRIEVGYGLEGALNDATARRIIAETITPKFKEGKFYEGIDAGLTRIIGVVSGEPLPETWHPSEREAVGADPQAGDSLFGLGFGLIEFLIIGLVLLTFAGKILRSVFGRLAGSAIAGFVGWTLAMFFVSTMFIAVIVGIAVFIFSLLSGGGRSGGWGGGGFSSGSSSGSSWSSSSSDSFSGGGGDFGGGGASGDW